MPAVSAVIRALTAPGDQVLVQTPVYNCFFSSVRNNECETVCNPLLYANVRFTVDYDDLESKAARPEVKIMLLCNPHNPAGRVWTREELMRIDEICIRNGVTVVSDEIHGELVFPGYAYTPFASLSDEFLMRSVTCLSPGKTFNTAGLQIANIVSADAAVRAKIDKAININEVCDVNPFGVAATVAAYCKCEEWLTQLNEYLWQNYCCMRDFFREYLPEFPVAASEGTYLAWIDCRALHTDSETLEKKPWKKHSAKKPGYGSMPARCTRPGAKDSCVGTSLVRVRY